MPKTNKQFSPAIGLIQKGVLSRSGDTRQANGFATATTKKCMMFPNSTDHNNNKTARTPFMLVRLHL